MTAKDSCFLSSPVKHTARGVRCIESIAIKRIALQEGIASEYPKAEFMDAVHMACCIPRQEFEHRSKGNVRNRNVYSRDC